MPVGSGPRRAGCDGEDEQAAGDGSMDWIGATLDRLAAAPQWRYRPGGTAATEPTALAAWALAAAGRPDAARRGLAWLSERQATDGSLGVSASEAAPCWPTCLAVLAWTAGERVGVPGDWRAPTDRAVQWILGLTGVAMPKLEHFGHDSALVGWPWVAGTHSWVEPTAWALWALRAVGHAEHVRARQAARLLVDRLLPEGGCNYGNTIVLDQVLRPHLLPSGLCLAALAGEADSDGRIGRTIDYLAREIRAAASTASLCYALLGLAAVGRRPEDAERLLAAAAQRSLRHATGDERLALVVLASQSDLVGLGGQSRVEAGQ